MSRRKLFICLSIVLYFTAASLWSSPFGSPRFRSEVRSRISPVFVPLGLWQGWDMFAPDPPHDNVILKYELLLSDGSLLRRDFVRPGTESVLQATLDHKYTKWASRLYAAEYQNLWPDLAMNLAIRARRAGLDVREVRLWKYWDPIADPVSGWVDHRHKVSYAHSERFFVYRIPDAVVR